MATVRFLMNDHERERGEEAEMPFQEAHDKQDDGIVVILDGAPAPEPEPVLEAEPAVEEAEAVEAIEDAEDGEESDE